MGQINHRILGKFFPAKQKRLLWLGSMLVVVIFGGSTMPLLADEVEDPADPASLEQPDFTYENEDRENYQGLERYDYHDEN